MADTGEDISRDPLAVGRIAAIPALLQLLCETSGMGCATVACRVDGIWTACAVHDEIASGAVVGGRLDEDPVHDMSVPIVWLGNQFGKLRVFHPDPAKSLGPRLMPVLSRFAELIALELDGETARQANLRALGDERASGQLREQFIAILSHDLRNPLQAFFAGCEVLAKRIADPMALNVVSRMKSHAQRMSGMINDVLDASQARLGSGMELEIAETSSLAEALRTWVMELQKASPQRAIHADIGVRQRARCDLARLRQLFVNLLEYAVAQTAADEPVKCSAKGSGSLLRISVCTGTALSPEELNDLFSPHRRAASSQGGLGLRLYLCSEIVRAHGGQLTASSTEQGGADITALLPCLSAEVADGTAG